MRLKDSVNMNERIRELAEQSRKYARDYVAECKHYGHYMEHNEYELRFEEKFAESIVRQCGFELVDESLQYNSPLIQEFTVKVANRLKARFGVNI